MTDVITRIEIENVRSIAKERLDLRPLNVLIGENGSGKSTVVEVCELLRRIPSSNFMTELFNIHSGYVGLLRQGQTRMQIRVRMEDDTKAETPMEYTLAFHRVGDVFGIEFEQLLLCQNPTNPLCALERTPQGTRFFNQDSGKLEPLGYIGPGVLALNQIREPQANNVRQRAIDRAVVALEGIDVQLPFDSRPAWVNRMNSQPMGVRDSVFLQPADRMQRLGWNLPSVYHQLRDRGDWNDTLELVRLGLGEDVENITLPIDPSGGRIGIGLKFRGMEQPVSSMFLSEGQITFLGLAALHQLARSSKRSLLCFDEPELHLHPGLVGRAAGLFTSMSSIHPVLLATHSDTILNHLEAPSDSAILCRRRNGSTRFLRPDPKALDSWLKEYQGLGRSLSEGAEDVIFQEPA